MATFSLCPWTSSVERPVAVTSQIEVPNSFTTQDASCPLPSEASPCAWQQSAAQHAAYTLESWRAKAQALGRTGATLGVGWYAVQFCTARAGMRSSSTQRVPTVGGGEIRFRSCKAHELEARADHH